MRLKVFLFAGTDAEKSYHLTGKFDFVNTGGYYHSLPLDPLRKFIDSCRRGYSERWALAMRKITRKLRPANSRLITAMARW